MAETGRCGVTAEIVPDEDGGLGQSGEKEVGEVGSENVPGGVLVEQELVTQDAGA